jgi:DNA-binding response OmpR family regulator
MAKKILLIDDEANIIKVLRSRLEAENFAVITASDGQEGLEKARSEKPDLIILDILMPRKDGYTFIKEMQVEESIKHIPVIVSTAKPEMQDLFAMEGIKDYIVKPFKTEELLKKIIQHLK